jgi:hypothetical protein
MQGNALWHLFILSWIISICTGQEFISPEYSIRTDWEQGKMNLGVEKRSLYAKMLRVGSVNWMVAQWLRVRSPSWVLLRYSSLWSIIVLIQLSSCEENYQWGNEESIACLITLEWTIFLVLREEWFSSTLMSEVQKAPMFVFLLSLLQFQIKSIFFFKIPFNEHTGSWNKQYLHKIERTFSPAMCDPPTESHNGAHHSVPFLNQYTRSKRKGWSRYELKKVMSYLLFSKFPKHRSVQ